jgi:signal transduction histidine kinase
MDQPLTVLLIEDSPEDVAEALATASARAFTLERHDRLEAAVERLGRGDVAVVLLDVVSAVDTRLDHVATLTERFDVPVVVLTDDRDPAAALAALRAGAQDCLVKTSLEADALARAVRHAVERYRAAIERRVRGEHDRRLQAMDAVGRLAGGVAHDFNNLLTVISGRGELLRSRLTDDDPLSHDVAVIQQTADRAVALTRRLLALSRRQAMQPRVLDLNALASATLPLLQRTIGPGIELRFTPAADLGPVSVDPLQIEQVLLNLVTNARDAMGERGTVTVQTGNVSAFAPVTGLDVGVVAGPCVRLTVADTGVGVDGPTRAHMFEPFFSRKRGGKGVGLGLATVAGIVQQSGGAVAVESVVGRTAVHVYLPRADAAAATPEHARVPRAVARGTETILLADDEDEVRAVARDLLVDNGYTVLDARTAADAVLIAERHGGVIDLLLTDVAMPEMRGPELAARVARLRPETRVLYMSAYLDDSVPRAHAIQKPFSPRGLVARVREILDG